MARRQQSLTLAAQAAVLACLMAATPAHAAPKASGIEHFLFIGGSAASEHPSRLTDDVAGVQVVYNWRKLEPKKGVYDFSAPERDLAFLSARHKKLWLQLQDRFFRAQDRLLPDYILHDPEYAGGLARQRDNPGEGAKAGSGWVARQWNPEVRQRFQSLLAELARRLDGKIYGINLPESSADIDIAKETMVGFSCDQYFAATLDNANFARSAFALAHVVQYVNFWPCEWDNDHGYMERFFHNAVERRIGLGGPDIIPYRKGQMKNAYPFFHRHKGQLATVAFAVQEPTRTYINPKTKQRFTDGEFLDFARDYLGATVIFWSVK